MRAPRSKVLIHSLVVLMMFVNPLFPTIAWGDEVLSWEFQNNSDILEKTDLTKTQYSCDPTLPTCRLNLKFSDIRPSPKSHYTCTIDYGFVSETRTGDCNPNQVEVPEGSWTISVIVTDSDTGVEVSRSVPFTISRTLTPEVPEEPEIVPPETFQPLDFSSLAIAIESGLTDDFTCKTEACQTNLIAAAPTDALCHWDFGTGTSAPGNSEKCNPGYVNFASNTSITLTVTDPHFPANIFSQTVQIKTKPAPPEVPPVTPEIDPNLPEFVRMDFSRLDVVIDSGLDDTFTCKTETCQINFHIDVPTDAVCHWDFGTGISSAGNTEKCNPGYVSFPSDTSMTVTVSDPHFSDNVFSQIIPIKIKSSVEPPVDDTPENPDTPIEHIRMNLEPIQIAVDSGLDAMNTCTGDSCQVNFSLNPVPPTGAMCSWDFGPEAITHTNNLALCNPGYVKFPSNATVVLTVADPNFSDNSIVRTLVVKRKETTSGDPGDPVDGGSETQLDLTTASITIQSGLNPDSSCRTATCQTNLLATAPIGTSCNWDFGSGVVGNESSKTSCNPGYVNFPEDATIILTISDPHFPDNIRTITQKISRFAPNGGGGATDSSVLTTESLQAVISLQGKLSKNRFLTANGLECILSRAQTCSVNLTAEDSTGATKYYWDFGNGNLYEGKNPPAQKFTLGTHVVILTVQNSTSSQQARYEVVVSNTKKQEIIEPCRNCENYRGKLHISAILANPPHTDTVEWIEIRNTSDTSLSLDGCSITDDSEEYLLEGNLSANQTLRLRQSTTGFSLGNKHDDLHIFCGNIEIDEFIWDFAIPSNYILRREVLQGNPVSTTVERTIDGDTIEVTIDGKKTKVRLLGIDTPETVDPRKPIQPFGKQASEFTKRELSGKTVWLTFDQDPIDKYGRRLAYVWICPGNFSPVDCTLFNSRVVKEGVGRMERRFAFRYYDDFIGYEKDAKSSKLGVWSDKDVAKVMDDLSAEEKEVYESGQEQNYLELQEELLQTCESSEASLSREVPTEEAEGCERNDWKKITEGMSTLNASTSKTGKMKISGRTWGNYSIHVNIRLGEVEVATRDLQSDESGEYEYEWYPREIGDYSVQVIILEKRAEIGAMPQGMASKQSEGIGNMPPGQGGIKGGLIAMANESDPSEQSPGLAGHPQYLAGTVTLEKLLTVEAISDHFSSPPTASIQLQGAISKNRWIENDIFECRSRGSCSVNLTAETNRDSGVSFLWKFPDNSISDKKNLSAFKVEYGTYVVGLSVTDEITGEKVETTFQIHHAPIPKAHPSTSSGSKKKAKKFTLDIHDAPEDMGGGVVHESETPFQTLGMSLLSLILCLGFVGLLFRKKI